jgi:aminoglycoside/choline kinase family phosphotransferase
LAPDTVQLNPAQTGFLKKAIPSFDPASWAITSAGHAGSDRKFVRVKSRITKESFVLVIWDSNDHDWVRFISIQRDVSPLLPFLPRIFGSDDGHGLILEEDLGSSTLKKYCSSDSATLAAVETIYKQVLDALVQWQGLDTGMSATIAARDMDIEMFLWETEYFTTHCVREYFGLDRFVAPAWEKERQQLAAEAAAFPRVCIHRDFQSENIMLLAGKIRFVDYQGARRGPAAYDVASLLLDPYVEKLTPELSKRLLDYYLSIAPAGVTPHSFRICALQRLMQALGAYANLSIHKGKDWYREYIPVALQRLNPMVNELKSFPSLEEIVRECLDACEKKIIPLFSHNSSI